MSVADEDGSKLHHKNIYGLDKPFSKEEKRKDGNYEMSWCVISPASWAVRCYNHTPREAMQPMHSAGSCNQAPTNVLATQRLG